MDSLIFYWVLTLIVLIILIMLTDVGTASIITAFIMIMKFISQPYRGQNMRSTRSGFDQPKKQEISPKKKTVKQDDSLSQKVQDRLKQIRKQQGTIK